jgi:hypothetical protein
MGRLEALEARAAVGVAVEALGTPGVRTSAALVA